jgi:uncharacterized protein (UPF0335 family)
VAVARRSRPRRLVGTAGGRAAAKQIDWRSLFQASDRGHIDGMVRDKSGAVEIFYSASEVNILVISLLSFSPFHYQGATMSDVTIPGGKIRAFVERIENLDTEVQELNEQKKEVFSEAKGEGFDVKILKEIIKLRKQDQEERDEREGLLDLYMRAMEQAGPEKVAKAA